MVGFILFVYLFIVLFCPVLFFYLLLAEYEIFDLPRTRCTRCKRLGGVTEYRILMFRVMEYSVFQGCGT